MIFSSRFQKFAAIVLLVGTVLRFPQIVSGMSPQHLFRQSQTAAVSRNIAEEGFIQGGTLLEVFGPGSRVPFEFPLFQQLVAMLSALGLGIEFSGQLLALLFFQLSAILATRLVLLRNGEGPARAFVISTQVAPFGVNWSTAFLIEFLAVFLGLLMLTLFDLWTNSNTRRRSLATILLSLCAAVLAGLVKITTLGIFLVMMGFWALLTRQTFQTTFVKVASFLFLSAASISSSIVWTSYADNLKSATPATAWLTSSQLRSWNFGTVSQRLDPQTWLQIFEYGEQIWFSHVIALVAIASLAVLVWQSRATVLETAAVASALSGPIVFTNLYFVHSYYMSAVYFQILMVIAPLALRLAAVLRGRSTDVRAGALVLLVALTGSTLMKETVRTELWSTFVVRSPSEAGEELRAIAEAHEDSIIVVTRCDWNPQIHWETGLILFMIPGELSPGGVLGKLRENYHLSWEDADLLVDCIGFGDDFSSKIVAQANFIPVSKYVALPK